MGMYTMRENTLEALSIARSAYDCMDTILKDES